MAKREPILATRGTLTPGGDRIVGTGIVVKGGLHFIRSNGKPYFSLTCDIYERSRDVGGGADHKTILRKFPHLKPLADLHLSDIDGVPMHAEANGWYWLAGAIQELSWHTEHHGGNGQRQHWKPSGEFDGYRNSTPDECLATYAEHVRLSIDEVQVVRQLVLDAYLAVNQYDRTYTKAGVNAAREAHKAWIEAQKPRWKREAMECINGLQLQVFGDEWAADPLAA